MPIVLHIHLHVRDLAKSRAFYEVLLGVPPAKVKDDYVAFHPPAIPLRLALSPGRPEGAANPPVDHLGIVVESTDEVLARLGRVRAAGVEPRVEMGVACCYADQDKFWVRDPDGVSWEVYHLKGDLETRGGPAMRVSALNPETASATTPPAGGCCNA